ncbi:unnamed protein product [Meganyctiphanes norvegica]|uniref:C-type lectin domain-containing protein n=1 Tax=Meganyctiphanes norvegica TaxID=48144 RepID=A0AAV2SZ48_MEGNR
MCSVNYTAIAGECFHFSEDKQTYDRAQEACKGWGDLLAAPRDVQAFMKYIANMTYTFQYYFVDGRKDSHWHWRMENEDKTLLNVSVISTSGNCLGILPGRDQFYRHGCSDWDTKYICQKPMGNYEANANGKKYAAICNDHSTLYIFGTICLILMLLVAILSLYIHRKRKLLQNKVLDSAATTDPLCIKPTRHDSENSLYGQTLPKGGNLPQRHDSENSLYGQSLQK